MKDFKNTTRMVSGHTHVPASQFHTFGKPNPGHRMAVGGPVPHVKDSIHGQHDNPQLTQRDPSGNFAGHAAVHRAVPSTEELAEHGGKGPLNPGYAHGGKAEKHFHVHQHFHSGGKTKTKSKHYAQGGRLKKMEMQAEQEHHAHQNDPYGAGGSTGSLRNKRATGGTINRLKKGGMHINPAHKGKFTKKMTGSKHGHLTGKDVQKGLHSESGETRKEANFARMARRGFKPLHKAKGGHIIDSTHEVAPDYKKGGTCKATGGTINKLGAGGALYARGGLRRR